MKRFVIMLGFVLMFVFIRVEGNLNMYINTKYAYLSDMTIAILSLLCVVEFIRVFREERAEERRKALEATEEESRQKAEKHHDNEEQDDPSQPYLQESTYRDTGSEIHDNHSLVSNQIHDHDHHAHDHERAHDHDHHAHNHDHIHDHDHHAHNHGHAHDHDQMGHSHAHDHDGHSHGNTTRLQRAITYLILCVPIYTGIFLPIQTLDSSFVKAKGFSFPSLDVSADNPGNHQFLRPDTSIFYGKDGYEKLKKKELAEFAGKDEIPLNETDYLKGMEVLYNFPGEFMSKTVSFDGFAYKGEQVEGNHYFVFRFGFIHCAADSGVFGMLVDFPKGTELKDDDWVHVTGTLSSELYQPFKQTLPVLEVTSWDRIEAPKNPYVYRNF
ncbi:TIGR03943 family putative permease subunit [Gorillibacterium timonense]|uniref:TIGR03943 family putative permease subunit n=1 Tax=Gorillibacterium timonense TaxID=1689269 RepID=UPI00071E3EBA|nr:TIGR03943 family protein [Gorillibacterium timonense]